MWNHRLVAPAFDIEDPKGRSRWILPMIRGFVDQASQWFCKDLGLLTDVEQRSTSSLAQCTSRSLREDRDSMPELGILPAGQTRM